MVASAWEWLFGPDPGWLRLWVAARVVCTAAATLTVLLLLQYRMTVPFDAIGLGLMVSIFATVNLRDPTPARQRVTLLVIPLPALGAWALAAYLNHWQWLADIGFILVVFCASLARLLGPRGTAWGMVAYIAYFISDVTRSQLSHHSAILLAVAVAICAGYLNRFYVLADNPAATLDHVLRYLRRRVARILGEIASAARPGEPDDRYRAWRDRQLVRLRAGALVAKQQIDFLAREGKLDRVRERAALDLLRLELGLERLLRLPVSGMGSEKEQAYLRLRLVALQRHLTGCVGEIGPCLAPAGSKRLRRALDLLEQAIMALPADLEGIPRTSDPASPGNQTRVTEPPTFDNGRDQKSTGRDENSVEKQPEKKKLLEQPAARQALQNALSVGLAIGIGSLVSSRRWYWAAIAAFIVGTGINSRGEGLVKALQRLVGTIVGIVVGLYLGSLVSGHTDLTLALVLVCIFFGFYAFQAAYTVMMFWITIMVALLYSLLGLLQPVLLILRLEETAIGSAVGVVVIMTLLPLRTHQVLGSALGELLGAIGNVVDQAAGDFANRRDDEKLIAAAWEIAEKTNALRDAIGPLKRGWERLSPASIRIAIGIAEDLAYTARELAFAAAGSPPDLTQLDQFQPEGRCVRRKLDSYSAEIKAARARFRCREPQNKEAGQSLTAAVDKTETPFGDKAALLDLMNQHLDRLRATCLGVAP